jgi:hypothetical protein
MFLPIPPSTIADLSAAHTRPNFRKNHRILSDLDMVLIEDSLRPDPLYMGLHAFFTTGPIGRLRSRYDAWQEEREERRYEAERAVDAASRIVQQPRTSTLTPAARERIDHDLAA